MIINLLLQFIVLYWSIFSGMQFEFYFNFFQEMMKIVHIIQALLELSKFFFVYLSFIYCVKENLYL